MKKKLTQFCFLAFLGIFFSTSFVTKGFGQQMGYTETTLPITLNPLYMEDVVSFRFLSLLYSRLWKRGAYSSIPVPHLLASLKPESISSDGLKYRFRIGPQIRDASGKLQTVRVPWHSQSGSSANVSLTAKDVAFTFNLIKNSEKTTVYRGLLKIIKSIEAVENDLIEVTLKPMPGEITEEFVLGELSFAVLPEHVFSNAKQKIAIERDFGKKIVIGTGPYVFTRYDEDAESYLLKRNPNYFEGWRTLEAENYRIDCVVMMHVRDENAGIDYILKSREVQLIPDTRQTDWERLKRPGLIAPYEYNARGFMYIGYNCAKAQFKDVKVRQALSYAMDRKNMLEVIYGKENVDEKRIQYGPFPLGEGDPDLRKKFPKYENRLTAQNEAKRLLKEAGFVDSDQDGFLEQNGKRWIFELMVYTNREDERRICERYQDHLQKIGVDVKIVYVDKDTWLRNAQAGNFDAIFGQWLFNEDTDIVADLFTPDGGHNFVDYNNPKVNDLVKQNELEFSPRARQENKNSLDAILAEECPYTFLFSIPKYAAVKTTMLDGVVIDPYYFFDHISNWYLKTETVPCPK